MRDRFEAAFYLLARVCFVPRDSIASQFQRCESWAGRRLAAAAQNRIWVSSGLVLEMRESNEGQFSAVGRLEIPMRLAGLGTTTDANYVPAFPVGFLTYFDQLAAYVSDVPAGYVTVAYVPTYDRRGPPFAAPGLLVAASLYKAGARDVHPATFLYRLK